MENYKDILEKLKYHKQIIMNAFIKNNYYPSNEEVKAALSKVNARLSLFESYISKPGSYFNFTDGNNLTQTIQNMTNALDPIVGKVLNDFYTGDNTGTIISSILTSTNSYYSNNKKIQLTEDAMKSDMTAWKLNTLDGSEENSGVWTRGTDGYPTFANEDS